MSDGLELTAEYRAEVEAILALKAPGIEASDLDLVLRSADLLPVSVSVLSGLIDASDGSDLPVIVDLHDCFELPDSCRVRS